MIFRNVIIFSIILKRGKSVLDTMFPARGPRAPVHQGPDPQMTDPSDKKHLNTAAASTPLQSSMTWHSSISVGLLLLADDECCCWFGGAAEAAGGGLVLGKPSV